MAWLAQGFSAPSRVELPTGHHLRPIREDDVAIDYPAVMGSRERLWAKYGDAWGWPEATIDLRRRPATWPVTFAGTDLKRALDDFVPRWLTEVWRFNNVHFAP